MSSSDVHELLVSIRPEGAKETRQEIEQTSEAFEESSDDIKESSDVMSRFSRKFRGAMKIAVAGLAIGAAGLLSFVPVISELFQGLKAIVTAVAIQLDKVLRPVLEPVTKGMFELADAIAAGDWQRVRDIVNDVAQAFANANFGQFLQDAIDGISDFLRSANLMPIVRSLFQGIKNFVGFAANALADFLVEVIKVMPGGELLLEIVDVFLTVLDGLTAWAAAATERVSNFLDNMNFKNIVQTIADGLVAVSKTFTNGIIDLVKEVNWQRVGGALKEQFLQAAKNALTGNFPGRDGDGTDGNGDGTGTQPGGGMFPVNPPGGFADPFRTTQTIPNSPRENTGSVSVSGDTELNLDGRTIGSVTKKFTVRGALNNGRGSRL